MRGPSLLLERRAFNRAVTSAVSLMSLRSGAWGEHGRDRGEWGRDKGEWGRDKGEWGRDKGEQGRDRGGKTHANTNKLCG